MSAEIRVLRGNPAEPQGKDDAFVIHLCAVNRWASEISSRLARRWPRLKDTFSPGKLGALTLDYCPSEDGERQIVVGSLLARDSAGGIQPAALARAVEKTAWAARSINRGRRLEIHALNGIQKHIQLEELGFPVALYEAAA